MLSICVLQGCSCREVYGPGHIVAVLNGELRDLYGTMSVLSHKAANGLVNVQLSHWTVPLKQKVSNYIHMDDVQWTYRERGRDSKAEHPLIMRTSLVLIHIRTEHFCTVRSQ